MIFPVEVMLTLATEVAEYRTVDLPYVIRGECNEQTIAR